MHIDNLKAMNDLYRDLISGHKRLINEYDHKIQMNEIEIGKQLTEMERLEHEAANGCTLCLGECSSEAME